MFSAAFVAASDIHTDAFGIVPAEQLSPERSRWTDLGQDPNKVDEIHIFVGAKSLVAGREKGHAVALLVDIDGNLVSDDTRAGFTLGEARYISETLNGIAQVLFDPPTRAGAFSAGVSSAATQSSRAIFRVTADLSTVDLMMQPASDPAQIERFATLTSGQLTDHFGNSAPSGLGSQIVIQHDDGSISLVTPTVKSGTTSAEFLTRDINSGGSLTLNLGAQSSNVSDFELIDTHLAAPTQVQIWGIPEIAAIGVEIGPVLSSEGYALTDGTPIAVLISDQTGKEIARDGWIANGRFRTVLPMDAQSAPFNVEIETPLARETTEVSDLLAESPLIGGLK